MASGTLQKIFQEALLSKIKMKNKIFTLLILAPLIGLMNFISNSRWDYSPIRIVIKGKLVNLKTAQPLKKYRLYIDSGKMDEIDFYPDEFLIDEGKTNSNGEFLMDTYIDKNDPQFWMKVVEFAQINILTPNIDTTKKSDTLDLGTIYLVPYDPEPEIKESYNMPKSKKKRKEKFKKMTLTEVDSIFKSSTTDYQMEMNSIDTLIEITCYNFGPDNPGGSISKEYKQLTFRRIIK